MNCCSVHVHSLFNEEEETESSTLVGLKSLKTGFLLAQCLFVLLAVTADFNTYHCPIIERFYLRSVMRCGFVGLYGFTLLLRHAEILPLNIYSSFFFWKHLQCL